MKGPRDFRGFPPFLPENQKEEKGQQGETSQRNPSFQTQRGWVSKAPKIRNGISSKLDHEISLHFAKETKKSH